MSSELQEHETPALVDRGSAAFRIKAQAATQTFDYSHYTVRKVQVGHTAINAESAEPRARKESSRHRTALVIDGGKTTLNLTVSGSALMSK